jgi:hypothetical protein
MQGQKLSEVAARSGNYRTTLVGSTPLETWVFVKDDGAGGALCDAAGVFRSSHAETVSNDLEQRRRWVDT